MKLSVDDACASDVRVADLAKKYEIETIFYWPVEWRSLAYEKGYEPLNIADAMRIANEFEIGAHTVTHRHLTAIDEVEAFIEIVDSQLMLQRLFRKEVKKFCPPRGYTNKRLTGYALIFYESQRLTKGTGLVHIHPNSGANDNIPWTVAAIQARGPSPPFNDIELWCHSWELDKFNLWDELEEYLKTIGGVAE